MNELSKMLVTMVKEHEGKNFDAILIDDMAYLAGFSFMSQFNSAIIHIHTDRIMISEPITGKYFCLPINGIKEIHDETASKYDVAFTVHYKNDYKVFIQIFEPFWNKAK
ncbi:hypothetical protein [Bacillus sp. J33]|uniref:hypothetical protein n=1 Tax=Bacillus sp. J33 TaxID=935836 RepID=UPI00047869AF|nr:hypothetical protein [Bacillus sp. J33]